jgi:acetyl esterase/lipase
MTCAKAQEATTNIAADPAAAPSAPAAVTVSTPSAPGATATAPLAAPKPPPPGPDSGETHKNIEYAKVGDTALLLDLYLPKNHATPVPLVIWIHGGGWREGSKERPQLGGVLKSGMALASINYRLSPQAIFPAQLFDCKAAVRYLRAHAAEYGLDPDRIAAAGESAGGHLAALLGTTGQDAATEGDEGNPSGSSAVQAVVDFYGPPNGQPEDPRMVMTRLFLTAGLLGGDPAQKADEARFASPFYHVTAKACPFFIAHGDHDTLVPMQQSSALADALKKAGVETDLVIVPGKSHGFRDHATTEQAIEFLALKLKPS